MVNALWITAIGMGLVFLAILLLWGLMALLVRLTAEKPASLPGATPAPQAEELPGDAPASVEDAGRALRMRAAAAGVAVALALRGQSKPGAGGTPPASLSAWQAVQRAGELRQHNTAQRKGNP